jgi:hypothetical protein
VSNTPQTTSEFKILGAFAGSVGLFSIALYFTGWIYRWAYYGFFRIELNALNLPAQSFFFVPIQVFLGSPQTFLQALLALIIAVLLIRVTLWLLQPPNPQPTNNLSSVGSSSANSFQLRVLRLFQRLNRSKLVSRLFFLARWFIDKLRYIARILPSPLLKDLVIVAWILTILFWVARSQGEADARRAAVNDTSALPIITLVHPNKELGLGRNPKDLFTDSISKKTRVIGDIGLFEKLQGQETNDTANPSQPTVWRLLVNSNGWLYIFRTLPQNADPSKRPIVLAIREGGGEQMMILSPTTSETQSP